MRWKLTKTRSWFPSRPRLLDIFLLVDCLVFFLSCLVVSGCWKFLISFTKITRFLKIEDSKRMKSDRIFLPTYYLWIFTKFNLDLFTISEQTSFHQEELLFQTYWSILQNVISKSDDSWPWIVWCCPGSGRVRPYKSRSGAALRATPPRVEDIGAMKLSLPGRMIWNEQILQWNKHLYYSPS